MAQIQIVLKQVSTQESVRVDISLGGGVQERVGGGGDGGDEETASEAAIRATSAACISSISSLARQNPNSL